MASDAKIDSKSGAWTTMAPKWEIAEALLGGTSALRAAGEKYLPKFPRETDKGYKSRLNRAFLTRNMFREAVEKLTAKVFTNPVTVEDSESRFLPWWDDVDLQGNDLNRFSERVFRTCVERGLAHILVEFPIARPGMTLADEVGLRPYLVMIRPEDLIFASTERIGGLETLTHVRYRVTTMERDGFSEKRVERIYVREPGSFQIWRRGDKGDFVLENEGRVSIEPVPLVTLYADRLALMVSRPALDQVADTTLAYWQTVADYRNILHATMFPIFFLSGVEGVSAEELVISPETVIAISNAQGKAGFIDHSGVSVGQGRTELADLERRASILADEVMMPRGDVTATASMINAAGTNSRLRNMADAAQDVLQQALDLMAMFVGADTVGTVRINKDFGLDIKREDVKQLVDMHDRGIVSGQAVRDAAKRLAILPEDFNDAEDEARRSDESMRGLAVADDQ